MRRLLVRATQLFFTLALAPLLWWPRLAKSSAVRWVTSVLFGRGLAPYYQDLIESFGPEYGTPLREALGRLDSICAGRVDRFLDCGTGTGFVLRSICAERPGSTVVGVDIVPEMLKVVRDNWLEGSPSLIRADNLYLPLREDSVDVAVAHNTLFYLEAMARVVRPGGAVVIVDSAARWLPALARKALRRTGHFDHVEACAAGSGFYVVARTKAGEAGGLTGVTDAHEA